MEIGLFDIWAALDAKKMSEAGIELGPLLQSQAASADRHPARMGMLCSFRGLFLAPAHAN